VLAGDDVRDYAAAGAVATLYPEAYLPEVVKRVA
jgi:hypothetical protein